MPSDQLPQIETVPSLPSSELAALLDRLFEPSVSLHTLSAGLLRENHFQSYDDLITSIGSQLADLAESNSTSDTRWLQSILASHPRLGERRIESTQSQAEQAQLKAGAKVDEHRLAELNILYERTFPGMRYIVFVNGRDRNSIIDEMQSRISRGNIDLEQADAVKAMCQIAADRARKASTKIIGT